MQTGAFVQNHFFAVEFVAVRSVVLMVATILEEGAVHVVGSYDYM